MSIQLLRVNDSKSRQYIVFVADHGVYLLSIALSQESTVVALAISNLAFRLFSSILPCTLVQIDYVLTNVCTQLE